MQGTANNDAVGSRRIYCPTAEHLPNAGEVLLELTNALKKHCHVDFAMFRPISR